MEPIFNVGDIVIWDRARLYVAQLRQFFGEGPFVVIATQDPREQQVFADYHISEHQLPSQFVLIKEKSSGYIVCEAGNGRIFCSAWFCKVG